MASLRCEIRVYDTTGERQPLPDQYIADWDFTLRKYGGFGTFRITLAASMDETEFTPPGANWRVEFWFHGHASYPNGIRMFRGWVERPVPAIKEEPEDYTLDGTGLMGRFHTFLTDGVFVDPTKPDVSVAFGALIEQQLKNKLTGYRAYVQPDIGTTVLRAEFYNKTFYDSLQYLSQLALNNILWGVDTDAYGYDRLYVKKIPTTINDDYVFVIGKDVQEFADPSDLAEVVNAFKLVGGKPIAPNLLYNGSFEMPAVAGESSAGNLLLNPGFEAGSGEDATNWTRLLGAARKSKSDERGELPKSGDYAMEFDHNGEGVYQDVTPDDVSVGREFKAVISAVNAYPNQSSSLYFTLEGLNSVGTVIDILAVATLPVSQNTYDTFEVSGAISVSGVTQLRYRLEFLGPDEYDTLVDDLALYDANVLSAPGWEKANVGNAKGVVDWAYQGRAYHRQYAVKVDVSGADGTSNHCVVIRPGSENWLQVGLQKAYRATWRIWTETPLTVILGFDRVTKPGGTSAKVRGAAALTLAAGWQTLSFIGGTESRYNTLRPFLELVSNGSYITDANMVQESGLTDSLEYIDGDVLTYTFRASEDTFGEPGFVPALTAEARASEATYGLREKEVSVEEVTSYEAALNYATGYLNTYAVPRKDARLVIPHCDRLLRFVAEDDLATLQGMVRVIGSEVTIDDKVPDRIVYRQGEGDSITCEIELPHHRMDFTYYLRNLTGKKGGGLSSGGGGSSSANQSLLIHRATSVNTVAGGDGTGGKNRKRVQFGPSEPSPYTAIWDASAIDRTGGTANTVIIPEAVSQEDPIDLLRDLHALLEGDNFTVTYGASSATLTFLSGSRLVAGELLTVTYTPA